VKPLVYVDWPSEPAFLLNLSERGMAVQVTDVLRPGQSLPFAFPLPDTGAQVTGMARIVWTDRSGRAGLEFVDLPEYDRFRLRQWVGRQQN
jgi:hypothetical protein